MKKRNNNFKDIYLHFNSVSEGFLFVFLLLFSLNWVFAEILFDFKSLSLKDFSKFDSFFCIISDTSFSFFKIESFELIVSILFFKFKLSSLKSILIFSSNIISDSSLLF